MALKQLRRHKRGRDEEDWVLAVYDVCNETSLLARLASHENIVTIMGVCKTSVSSTYKNHDSGYFFVMEKLEDILSNRLNGWRKEIKQSAGPLSRLRRSHSLTSMSQKVLVPTSGTGSQKGGRGRGRGRGLQLLSSQAVYQRLSDIAIGIARAMSHLHSTDFQIAIRDLKPANIGFDQNGTVKLFDFGMARQVHETDTAELAGTFRYISPEAVLGHRIGLESDVYSFGVILYELVTLLKPFDSYFQSGKLVRKEAFIDACVVGGWRPSLSRIPCRATRRLIAKCWDPSPRARPCFDRIYFLLNHIVATNTDTGTAHSQPSVPSSRVINNNNNNNNNDNNQQRNVRRSRTYPWEKVEKEVNKGSN
jgi:serine/threonine protein kinase